MDPPDELMLKLVAQSRADCEGRAASIYTTDTRVSPATEAS